MATTTSVAAIWRIRSWSEDIVSNTKPSVGRWGLATLTSITGHDLIGVSYLGVIQLGVSYTLFTAGMAHGVRSLDAGIVCYIEPVLNPVWVFLVLGERPAAWAILGGAIIMVTVICHMLLDARGKRRASDAAVAAAHD